MHLALTDCLFGSLREDHHSGSGTAGLWLGGQLQGNGGQVRAVALGGSVRGGLGLIAEDKVGVRQCGSQLVAKELN